MLSSAALFVSDAYAANTEWFVAFFSTAAAAVFLAGGARPSSRRLAGVGALLALMLFNTEFDIIGTIGRPGKRQMRRPLPINDMA